MSAPTTPYGNVPQLNTQQQGRGYGGTGPGMLQRSGTGVSDFGATQGNPSASTSSPLAQQPAQSPQSPQSPLSSTPQGQSAFREEVGNSPQQQQTGETSTLNEANGSAPTLERSTSRASTAVPAATPSRGGTLKKRTSLSRKVSLRRSGSKRSFKAGSIKGIETDDDHDYNSAFHTPIPTSGVPTDVLANRFQAWRQLLKSLIAYFREIQTSYDQRAKAVQKVQNTIQNISHPSSFISDGGLGEATRILTDYHKHTITEANKSRDIENDVVGALTGLRSDLGQKIKEIKGLSGDFKNSVDKEQGSTRRALDGYQSSLQHVEHEDANAGKNDPYLMKLGVDRCVERQIDEENYLHRAYLNLESSGRELESIVVGEIQKAYNAFAGILKREGDDAFSVVESLRTGPIALPKDMEWKQFVEHDPHFINPSLPLRQIEQIEYPGKDHPSGMEVRAGMLERKSKYLKSYTPGWYVLSSTHLHEFKSADKIYSQPPIMSLYLPEQKLGSKSEEGSSSHKFMLKGKQSSGMHRGHNWVFRAESYETMLAWYEAIKALTEKTGEERNAYVRKHASSVSGNSARSVSSDGMEEDEADKVPYSADAASLSEQNPVEEKPQRPQPGGRFPSDMNVPRNEPLSPSDDSSETDAIAASSGMPGSGQQEYEQSGVNPYALDGVAAGAGVAGGAAMAQRRQYEQENNQPAHEEIADRNIQADHDRSEIGPAPPTQQYFPPVQQQPIIPIYQSEPPQQQQNPFDRFHGAAAAMPGRSPEPRNYNSSPFQSMDEPLADPIPAASTPAAPTPAAPMPAEPTRADTQQPLYRHQSSYADWLAPAAAGAGAGALGTAAYNHHRDNNNAAAPAPVEPPVSSQEPYGAATYSPVTNQDSTFGGSSGFSNRTSASNGRGNGLGGLEKEGARETGNVMPPVVRHDTDMSVSKLHVPGEWGR